MKTLGLAVVLGGMLTPLEAETVIWRAMGEVAGVVTVGDAGFAPLGIVDGQEMVVEFSDSDLAGRQPIRDFSGFGWFSEWDYPIGIDLTIRAQIGGNQWEGGIATATVGSPYTAFVKDVLGNIGETESLVLTVSDTPSEGGVFAPFPGRSVVGEITMSVEIHDAGFPYDFLGSRNLPDAMNPVLGEITSATGVIRSGDESISFAINPASIVVMDGPAGERMESTISVVDGEVTLAWVAEIGADYAIRWSENGRQWAVLTTVTADTEEKTHTFSPIGDAAAQYFQVSKND